MAVLLVVVAAVQLIALAVGLLDEATAAQVTNQGKHAHHTSWPTHGSLSAFPLELQAKTNCRMCLDS